MQVRALLIGSGLAAALIAASVSPAAAGPWHHRYHGCWFVGCVFDAAGAVVVGAAEIATAPLQIAADAIDGEAPYYGPPPAYGPAPGYAAGGYDGGPYAYYGGAYYGRAYYGDRRYWHPRRYWRRRAW